MLVGIDLGKKWVGIAKAFNISNVALPAFCLELKQKNMAIHEVVWKHICDFQPSLIVVGNPIEMSGIEGEMSAFAKNFVSSLKEIIPDYTKVVLWDERLSSVQAYNSMKSAGIKRSNIISGEDAVAASIILQSYMDANLSR